jgi:phosphatidylglycerophosphatase A
VKDFLVKFLATGLYSGLMKPFPGTWGTIPAWLIAFFLLRGDLLGLTIATVICFFASVWLSGEAEKTYGHDARVIVIDEWLGMFVTLLFVPYSLVNYALAFVAFRAFDVFKIYPARQLEQLPGGWGITMDDLAAGVQANLFVQIMIYAYARLA